MRVKPDKMGNNENGSQRNRLTIFSYNAPISGADAWFGLVYLLF
jgi:hypothetical protein